MNMSHFQILMIAVHLLKKKNFLYVYGTFVNLLNSCIVLLQILKFVLSTGHE